MKAGTIGLLTDFGQSDWYVGVMKGVLLGVNPLARIVDITHTVPPQDILGGSFALLASRNFLPRGTVFVVVVDPGVGTARSILCARSREKLYLAPDNGVLTEVLDRDGLEDLVRVENRAFFLDDVGSTFHGRDVFAAVAGHLSLGLEMDRLGPKTTELARCDIPRPRREDRSAWVTVRWIDVFGNMITDCSGDFLTELASAWKQLAIDVGGRTVTAIGRTYQSVEQGEPVALVGSSGYLEISIRGGNAAQAFGAKVGHQVRLRKA